MTKQITYLLAALTLGTATHAQDTVRYTGQTLSNVDYHHGMLRPAIGVHNIQVFRANREHPEWAGGTNWTYNHQPMLAYWQGKFYLEYLSDPVGEHVPPGQTLLCTSSDGYHWTNPEIVFPSLPLPDGLTKSNYEGAAHHTSTVNHQRMGFFHSSKDRMLMLAFYGIVLGPGDDPNDGHGMGRAVREIYKDGKLGPIYFLRFNKEFSKNWAQKTKTYPFYTSSKDKGFVEACNEILASPLMMQQMVEEADRDDPLIPLHKDLKAFSYYHLNDGRVVGLWKNALTSISNDGGKTWAYSPLRAPGFVNSNAKIWGQKTEDGKFLTVYNPSEFRWPMALSVSDDGLNYKNLLLLNGEIPAMRYGGAYKSYGPQYLRGITETEGNPPGTDVWLTYAMNKEDIWAARLPIPVRWEEHGLINEDFNEMPAGHELDNWNINSGSWSPVQIEPRRDRTKMLTLADWDPFTEARAERVIESTAHGAAEFRIEADQKDHGRLEIDLMNPEGLPAARFVFDSAGNFQYKAGYRYRNIMKYEPGTSYTVKIEWDCASRFYKVWINDKAMPAGLFFNPVHEVSRVVFRTGSLRRFPDADTPTDQDYDLPNGGEKDPVASYHIYSFKTLKP